MKYVHLQRFPSDFLLYSQDLALVRKSFGLEKRIALEGDKEGLSCKVHYWTGAWEVEETFATL